MKTDLASFYVFVRYFCCSKSSEQTHQKKQKANVTMTRVLQELGQRTNPSVLMHDENGVLLRPTRGNLRSFERPMLKHRPVQNHYDFELREVSNTV